MPEYPNSDVVERAYVNWMYYKKNLRDEYLQTTPPAVFLKPERRLIIYVMQQLHKNGIEINVGNIVMFMKQGDEHLLNFMRKNKIRRIMTEDEIYDSINDINSDLDESYFTTVREWLLSYAFARFVEDRLNDMKYYNSYPGVYSGHIVASCRGILRVHDILYKKTGDIDDQLSKTLELVNSEDEYIRTSSQALNSFIGGWTRKYVANVIAKSGHTKSTWIDYDSVQSILTNKNSRVVIISPEEIAETRWRRVISMILNISITDMRQKNIKLSKDDIKKVAETLKDRFVVYDNVFKFRDIVELLNNVEADKIIIDHLQSIQYPGNKDYLANMIGNIPALVDIEKKVAKKKNIVIINLSQVNDKEIARSERLSKAPKYYDAYGSSVLYQASREYLAIYYPYKDFEDNPHLFPEPPSINDIIISVEKSSFTMTGKVYLKFIPEFSLFEDSPKNRLEKHGYVAPSEKTIKESAKQLGLKFRED